MYINERLAIGVGDYFQTCLAYLYSKFLTFSNMMNNLC